jgi:hypothetical protein
MNMKVSTSVSTGIYGPFGSSVKPGMSGPVGSLVKKPENQMVKRNGLILSSTPPAKVKTPPFPNAKPACALPDSLFEDSSDRIAIDAGRCAQGESP